jgi:DNA-binding NarL/FixJ family response regulator
VRIAIVEDSATRAEILRATFGRDSRFTLLDIVGTGAAAVQLPKLEPDIVVVDRMLPDDLAVADNLAEVLREARIYVYSATDPAAVFPAQVGYLRDTDMAQWPDNLSAREPPAGAFVKHPKQVEQGCTT